MRIGKFAKEYHVSIDTVRHYMDKGLIVPIKSGGQYDFTETCHEEMKRVLSLKKLDFTLDEIRSIMFYLRVTFMYAVERDNFMVQLLSLKEEEIEKEMKRLQEVKELLAEQKEEILQNQEECSVSLGVPLQASSFLCCPKCLGDLSLDAQEIKHNQIITGKFTCSCGEHLPIEEGILVSGDGVRKQARDVDFDSLFSSYVKNTNPEYFERIFSGFNFLVEGLNKLDLSKKKILDLGTGVGMFARRVFDIMPPDALMICVDFNLTQMKSVKRMFEKVGKDKQVLFIAAEFLDIPLKDEAVEVITDAVGLTSYQLNGGQKVKPFLFSEIDRIFSPDLYIFSENLLFERFSVENEYIHPDAQHQFTLSYLQEGLKENGIEIIEDYKLSLVPYAGRYELFYTEQDKVYPYCYIARRKEGYA